MSAPYRRGVVAWFGTCRNCASIQFSALGEWLLSGGRSRVATGGFTGQELRVHRQVFLNQLRLVLPPTVVGLERSGAPRQRNPVET
jgi:hypothetical protein